MCTSEQRNEAMLSVRKEGECSGLLQLSVIFKFLKTTCKCIILFIYLFNSWLHWVHCCLSVSLRVVSRGYRPLEEHGFWGVHAAALLAHRPRSCSLQAQSMASVVVVHRLELPAARGIFPDQGLNTSTDTIWRLKL